MFEYNKRLVEVDEILNYLPKEDLEKIPEDIRQLIKNNKDKDYIWKYDETKSLKEQNVSRDTIAFLSYLNMEYLLNDKQKEFMEKLHEINEKKLEEEKSKKYNSNNLFKQDEKIVDEPIENKTESLVEQKENFFSKIIKAIKSFFKK